MTIYASGPGAVTNAPADGAAAPVDPLARSLAEPAVFVGGRRAAVTFSGLAPGWVGLWQINAQVASDTGTGADVDLVVLYDVNLVSNAVKLTVE